MPREVSVLRGPNADTGDRDAVVCERRVDAVLTADAHQMMRGAFGALVFLTRPDHAVIGHVVDLSAQDQRDLGPQVGMWRKDSAGNEAHEAAIRGSRCRSALEVHEEDARND